MQDLGSASLKWAMSTRLGAPICITLLAQYCVTIFKVSCDYPSPDLTVLCRESDPIIREVLLAKAGLHNDETSGLNRM